ncbi:MAG: threonine--tRNA ligase [Gammaproteobacteria bacterium]|nr:threonine--tRNA ligase [Gammaproteobacteria bacterium]NIM71867.1 threonine--tRNA ligase [Gammaproteobacteria bacterium]NIN37989.1 threonine--tRNA ligase [Gammaproteobacteria bacterium]NIO23623.1 threonine--tRNA ligase [Gammaproteobacteria bacterium]NIO64239.1 threonine--tRNA ligase [Gammaproteobacteria bacterium]
MPDIRLPDGSMRSYAAPLTGAEIAADIGKRLAKDALAVRIDGELRDLGTLVEDDAEVAIVTAAEPDGLELLRHDAAHVMAEAVKELYPETQVTIGPAIENGFYYDFAREHPFTPEDLERIEARMREIVARNETITREVWDRDEAARFFREQGEAYKAEIIEDIPAGEAITLYRQGGFIDLCRGPHLPSTGRLGTAFKLTKVAGAYWRGDSRNAMLQRIYGTAWPSDKELKAYLHQLEEAERRDHRRLGREMGLFHFQEEAPGAVFWHPKGWTLFLSLVDYMRRRQQEAGYLEINTPDIMDRSLWEQSGHWETFGEHMYTTETPDERVYALKPMNCPGCVQVFKHGIRSYRELPVRMSEFGKVHRYEPSGALHGLLRVRAFAQDDAHIFCTLDQITDECIAVCKLILSIYRDFGFEDVHIKFADRPEKRVGSDDIWDKSEAALRAAIESSGLDYTLNPGEGAFYGPKLEFVLRDAIGRDWQCGTLQVDLNLPERLGAHYIGEDGNKHTPVMLHRALFGSLERFAGILIEHYAGRLPMWLAPLQVVVATITSDGDDYAREVAQVLRAGGLRVEVDLRNEKINYKVREHSVQKVPVLIAVGKREVEERSVSIRRLGRKGQESLGLEEAARVLKADAERIGDLPAMAAE